jgi:hypothetical protein
MNFLNKYANLLIFIFIILNALFLILRFINIEPMGDQAFQIYWLSNLINRDLFIPEKTNTNFISFLYEITFNNRELSINEIKIYLTQNYKDNFIYHLVKVMASPNNFFAYYWHSFYIIVLYVFNLFFGFLFQNLAQLYVCFSIIFSSLSIYLCYLIYNFLLQSINYSKNINLLNVSIFILVIFSYHKFYYSPLGVHNFAIFMFLLTTYFFLKIIINNSRNLKSYLFLGALCSLSIISHQANFLLLLPTIFISIFILSSKNYLVKFKNICSFSIFPSLILTPLLFLCYLTFIKTDLETGRPSSAFSLEYFLRFSDQNYTFSSISTWFKNITILMGPIILTSIFFINNFQNKILKNFYILLLSLFSIHMFFTFITGWFIESYLRNVLYLNYLISIIFAIIIFDNIAKKKFFYLTIILISSSFIFNSSAIFSTKNFKKLNNFFYDSYSFNSENNIKNFHETLVKKIKLENKTQDYHVFFFSQMSMSYLSIYNSDVFYDSMKNFRKPINQVNVIDPNHFPLDKKFENYYLYSIVPIQIDLDEKYYFNLFRKNYSQFENCDISVFPNLNNKIQLLESVYSQKFYKFECDVKANL